MNTALHVFCRSAAFFDLIAFSAARNSGLLAFLQTPWYNIPEVMTIWNSKT